MRCKHIILRIFVFSVFNLLALNPFPKSNPAPMYPMSPMGPGLYAQDVDLVKLKKEEEERKKKTKKSKYVVTNESIDKTAPSKKSTGVSKQGGQEAGETAGVDAGTDAGNQVATADDANTGTATEAEDVTNTPGQNPREYWQERAKTIYQDIGNTQADIQRSKLELDRLDGELQAEDIFKTRQELQTKMDEVNKNIAAAEQKLVDLNIALEALEDEARKKNVPAGWLRVEPVEPNANRQEGPRDKKK